MTIYVIYIVGPRDDPENITLGEFPTNVPSRSAEVNMTEVEVNLTEEEKRFVKKIFRRFKTPLVKTILKKYAQAGFRLAQSVQK